MRILVNVMMFLKHNEIYHLNKQIHIQLNLKIESLTLMVSTQTSPITRTKTLIKPLRTIQIVFRRNRSSSIAFTPSAFDIDIAT